MRWLLSNCVPAVVLLKNCLTNPQFGSINYVGISVCSGQSLRGRQLLVGLPHFLWYGQGVQIDLNSLRHSRQHSFMFRLVPLFPYALWGQCSMFVSQLRNLKPLPTCPANLLRGLLTNQPKRKILSFYLSGNRPAFWLEGRHFL